MKDVATLYEIWVFFKIAHALFGLGSEITVSGNSSGGLQFGTTWSANGRAASYNSTYAGRRGSYSVTLRPDVTINVGGRIWLFDAKYKSDRTTVNDDEDQTQISAAVKKIDLHKMHTYVDAISGVVAAVAAYPGTEINLFPRVNCSGNLLHDLFAQGGVGGIPLLPQCNTTVLEDVMSVITSQP